MTAVAHSCGGQLGRRSPFDVHDTDPSTIPGCRSPPEDCLVGTGSSRSSKSDRRRSAGSHRRDCSLRHPCKLGSLGLVAQEFSLKLYESKSTLSEKNDNNLGAGDGRWSVNSLLWGCLALWGVINCIIAVCLVRRASRSVGVKPALPNVLSQNNRHPADGLAI